METALDLHDCIIVQSEGSSGIGYVLGCMDAFLKHSRASRPHLLVVDETMDFFSTNGTPKFGSDIVLRSARAFRERGVAALYGSQRTHCIPGQLMSELTKCYLFRLDYESDAKRLQEMGAPKAFTPPTEDYIFNYWTKLARSKVWGPYNLDL